MSGSIKCFAKKKIIIIIIWQKFLHDDINKAGLFAFLAKFISPTTSSDVACIPPQDASYLALSDHEEVDTRMILH